jgi:excisionase family DNA binding protein
LPVSRRAALSAHARDVSATVQPREKTLGAISSVRQIAPTVICSRLHASPFGHAVPPRRSKSQSNPARPASRSASTEPVVALIGFWPVTLNDTKRLAFTQRQNSASTSDDAQRAEEAMRKHEHPNSIDTSANMPTATDSTTSSYHGLPNRLLTAFEVAEFIGCHEETVRRAYLRGLLTSQRFGVRGRRFHAADVLDWVRRGAPTRVS